MPSCMLSRSEDINDVPGQFYFAADLNIIWMVLVWKGVSVTFSVAILYCSPESYSGVTEGNIFIITPSHTVFILLHCR